MTTTTTKTKLVATEGVLHPMPRVRTGFAQHVAAQPSYWPQLDEIEQPKERRIPVSTVVIMGVAGVVSGVALWAVAKLAGLPLW